MRLVIVNTGCANISSVKFAVERLGYSVIVSDEPSVIASADKVFLPGVGTAVAAMQSIIDKGLLECIKTLQQPVLGICLGMQILATQSEEGNVACLNKVDAPVSRMKVGQLRLPHMGWNSIQHPSDHPLFDGIEQDTYFYFVHSYAVPLGRYTLAQCEYGPTFSAAITNRNFIGVQFHPERSGAAGAKLLQNFIERVS